MSGTPRPNRYARCHRRRLAAALEPGEPLLAANRVTFLGSASVSRWPRPRHEPAFVARRAAYRRWVAEMGATPFPPAGPDFVLGVTDRRWLVWRTTKWWSLPVELAGDLPHEVVAEVRTQRLLISGVLTIRYRDGGQTLIEAPLITRLRPLAAAHERATSA